MVIVICLLTAPLLAADKNNPKPKKKPTAAESALPKEKSVEEIAEFAKGSVVVISHFGRDGSIDGIGSGFVVSSNGLIATSLHVIGEARPISVQFADGRKYSATEVHAWDRKLDLAIIRIDATDLKPLSLGDSDSLKQGHPIVAMGNPRGLEHSIVQGVVSARRDIESAEMIQLAIPIEPGNSGGPLLDMQGRVHGILTLKSAVTENLGFAMPINLLKPLLEKPNPVPIDRWLTIGALNSREWTPMMGARWSQKSGAIQVEGPGTGFGGRSICLSQREVPARPFELAVTVRMEDESGAAGLIFASDSRDVHYGFYPTGGQMRLTRFDGPTVMSWQILDQKRSPDYHPGDWNTLKVRLEEERLLCYVNDQLIFESKDAKLQDGKVGLAKFRDTKAIFKNFQIARTVVSPAASPELVESITKQVKDLPTFGAPDEALIKSLQPHAQESQAVLFDRATRLEAEAKQLRRLASSVHQKQVQTEMVNLLAQPESKIDLFYAALLVAKVDNRDLDLETYRRQIEQMARDITNALPAKASAEAKLAELKRYLFAENGFHGSRNDYYNRANSYINEVMDDREGLPITLSVLFIELARRIGLESVVGYPLPGHFVVQYSPRNGEAQVLDVFDGGRQMTQLEVERTYFESTGLPMREQDVKPATKKEIILRMLRNLVGSALQSDTPTASTSYFDMIIALAPDAPAEHYSRAMVRMQTGDNAGARQDLLWLMDHQPPGLDLERIEQLLRSL